jgi:hypothetical protein
VSDRTPLRSEPSGIIWPLLVFSFALVPIVVGLRILLWRSAWDWPAWLVATVLGVLVVALVGLLLCRPPSVFAVLPIPAAAVVLAVTREATFLPSWANRLALLAGFLLAGFFLARQFSTRVLRTYAVVTVVLVVFLIAQVGRSATVEDQRAAQRATATELDGAIAEAWSGQLGSVESTRATLLDSLDELAERSSRNGADPRLVAVTPTVSAVGQLASQGRATEADQRRLAAELAEVDELFNPVSASTGARELRELQGRIVGEITEAQGAVDTRHALLLAGVEPPGDVSRPTGGGAAWSAARWVELLCEQAAGRLSRGAAVETVDECARADGGLPAGPREQALAMATARYEVAELQAAVNPGDEADAAVEAAQAAVDDAEAALDSPPPSTDFWTLLSRGADAIVESLPGFHGDDLPVALEAAGWIVLLIIALLFYRYLEIRSGRLGVGPVEIVEFSGGEDDKSKSRFRTYLLQNVAEPSAVPGGKALDPLTDLLDASSELSSSPVMKALQAIARAVKAAITPPLGYAVSAAYQPGEEGAADDHLVFLRVQDRRTKQTLASTTVQGRTEDEALQCAGFWTAGWIVNKSVVTPRWTSWSETTSKALAAYTSRKAPLDQLELAINQAPWSGLLSVRLGERYDLEGEHRKAFELYVRASTLYPRFLVARYRAAVSLSLLASDPEKLWASAPESELQTLVASFMRYWQETMGTAFPADEARVLEFPFDATTTPERVTAILAGAACRQLEAMKPMTGWWFASSNAFRRRERSAWLRTALPTRGTYLDRKRRRLIGDTCAALARLRLAVPEPSDDEDTIARLLGTPRPTARERALLDELLNQRVPAAAAADATAVELEGKARHVPSAWQVVYNLACYWAVRGRRDRALDLLDEALNQPNSTQVDRWLERDPDLANLTNEPRFRRLVARLPQKGSLP